MRNDGEESIQGGANVTYKNWFSSYLEYDGRGKEVNL